MSYTLWTAQFDVVVDVGVMVVVVATTTEDAASEVTFCAETRDKAINPTIANFILYFKKKR